MSSGLGEDWNRILDDLRVLAPIYGRGNDVLSFGRSAKLRRAAVASGLPPSGVFADVGCGPGSMAIEARRLNPSLEAVLVDPLPEMLAYATANEELTGANMVQAVYEYLPFRDRALDGYLAGFTLRDARDRVAAVREASRVLRPGGQAVVLDLGRPDSGYKRVLVAAYWRVVVPVLLFLFMGSEGAPFRDIYLTLRRLPCNAEVISIFTPLFAQVTPRKLMLDGVLVIVAGKAEA
ncbi:MAG: class I SAM-dependent methyltransferase [Conexivisphaerales archaeon]|jgi:demethylmenaquinone methyltransferase/2-methoxy-6-polyprenyl-1,4-benzoquinol methylase